MSTDLFSDFLLPAEGFVPSGLLPPEELGEPPASPPDPDEGVEQRPAPSSGPPMCEHCGKEIPWAGRGRKPKMHPECREEVNSRTRTNPSASRGSSTPKGQTARIQKIVGDLQEGLGEFTGTVMPFAPVTAMTIGMQGPAAVVALVDIAAHYPRFLDGLERAAMAVPFVAVARFAAAIMFALAVDLRKFKPEGIAAEMLGVAAAAEKVGWQDRVMVDEEKTVDGWAVPTPPRFSM